ncbi:MAG: helix-turn-helix transcriptional regulator [Catenulispora sp.]|nr:helix-turn-helix transcriptional regulator [Catenulispora sp.]
MRQTSFAQMHCSLARSLEIMGDWWSPLIVRDVWLGLRRFDQLTEDLGISRNLLTARLAHLVEHGILVRTPYQERPVRHEYSLGKAGEELVPVLQALTEWGNRWGGAANDGPPILFRHTACGHQFEPQVACDHCGQAVRADDVAPEPGPGGRETPGTMLVAPLLARKRL